MLDENVHRNVHGNVLISRLKKTRLELRDKIWGLINWFCGEFCSFSCWRNLYIYNDCLGIF